MDYMFQPGFLGTRAPLFMDVVTSIVALLPLLIALAIFTAKKKLFRFHIIAQLTLFVFSVIVVGYFEYGVRADGGFETFVQGSSLSENFVFNFLIFHIIVAVATLIWWSRTIVLAIQDYRGGMLSGAGYKTHKRLGLQSAFGIFMTTLTGLCVYLFLFLF
jgi:putative membrane protein